jgi:RHS repeat-associated protein
LAKGEFAYRYDPFGRLSRITRGGDTAEKFTYDGFDRPVRHWASPGPGAPAVVTDNEFDALDRKTRETRSGAAGKKTTEFAYLGTGKEVLEERRDGKVVTEYTFGPFGERLAQRKAKSAGAEERETTYFGYNAHSDVESVTDEEGNTKATYGYTAFGGDDPAGFSGPDKPAGHGGSEPAEEPFNVYRYNGMRWDGGSRTYDMGFRNYSPALNRFLSRDMYNGALADLDLATDPWTANRYAFAGGNPVTNIEIDGHSFWGIVAGIAAGVAVGVGCGLLVGWTGVGAIGCGALSGAVGSMVTHAVDAPPEQQNVAGYAQAGLIGGALGAGMAWAAPYVASAVGKVVSPLVTKAKNALGGGARGAAEGAEGAAADATAGAAPKPAAPPPAPVPAPRPPAPAAAAPAGGCPNCGGTVAGPTLGKLRVTAKNPSESEVSAAQHLAAQGGDTLLRDPVGTRAGGATSDLLVDGIRWDVYSPTSDSVKSILAKVAKKHSQVHGGGVVVDLSETGLSAADFGNALWRVNRMIASWGKDKQPLSGVEFFGGK